MYGRSARFTVVLLTCLAFDQRAAADPITYHFSGPIRMSFGTAPQGAGDVLVGSIALDTEALRITEQSGSTFRRYAGPADLSLSFRSHATGEEYLNYAFSGIDMDAVVNNVGGFDSFRSGFFNPLDPFFSFGLILTDSSGTAFSSAGLPLTVDLRAFSERTFFGSYWQFNSNLEIERQSGLFSGQVTSLNGIDAPGAVVPEPGTIVLSGIGLAALCTRRRRKQHVR